MKAPQNSGASARPPKGRPFQPGQSGNPGGRPKGIAGKVKELVGEDGEKALKMLWSIASDTKEAGKVRVMALEVLLNRGFGKPPATLELQGAGGSPVSFTVRVISKGAK